MTNKEDQARAEKMFPYEIVTDQPIRTEMGKWDVDEKREIYLKGIESEREKHKEIAVAFNKWLGANVEYLTYSDLTAEGCWDEWSTTPEGLRLLGEKKETKRVEKL